MINICPFARLFIGVAVAILCLCAWLLYSWQQRVPNPPCSTEGAKVFTLGLEQPIPGGKVVLDKMWLLESKPDENLPTVLRISARFISTNPHDQFFVTTQIAEAPDGFEHGRFSWYVPVPVSPDHYKEGEIPFILEYAKPPLAAKKLYVQICFQPKQPDPANGQQIKSITEFSFANPLRRTPK